MSRQNHIKALQGLPWNSWSPRFPRFLFDFPILLFLNLPEKKGYSHITKTNNLLTDSRDKIVHLLIHHWNRSSKLPQIFTKYNFFYVTRWLLPQKNCCVKIYDVSLSNLSLSYHLKTTKNYTSQSFWFLIFFPSSLRKLPIKTILDPTQF